jgi:hypothetical protein
VRGFGQTSERLREESAGYDEVLYPMVSVSTSERLREEAAGTEDVAYAPMTPGPRFAPVALEPTSNALLWALLALGLVLLLRDR